MDIPKGFKQPAVLCILQSGDKLLLLRRKNPPNAGKYTPVGGKLEPHEDPHTAAIRETREETGLDIPEFRYCGTLVETSPVDYNWICFVYVAQIDYQPAPECDEGTLEWIAAGDIPTLPTPTTDAHIYEHVLTNRPFFLNAIYDDQIKLLKMTEEISGTTPVDPSK